MMVTPNRTSRYRKKMRALKFNKEKQRKEEQKQLSITQEEHQERMKKLKEAGVL